MEDWGLRDLVRIRSHSRAGGGDQQGAPRQHVNRHRSALLPLLGLSHAPLPRGPIRLAVGPRTCRLPPPPLSPGPPAAISCPASRNQRSSVPGPRNAGPTVPIRLKASALAVAVHWALPLCDAAIFACLAVALAAGVGLLFASNFPSPGHTRRLSTSGLAL